jgi:hypothetical protein
LDSFYLRGRNARGKPSTIPSAYPLVPLHDGAQQVQEGLQSGLRCSAAPTISLVALRIIELVMAGERNAERLTARTLAEFGIGNDGSLWRH